MRIKYLKKPELYEHVSPWFGDPWTNNIPHPEKLGNIVMARYWGNLWIVRASCLHFIHMQNLAYSE